MATVKPANRSDLKSDAETIRSNFSSIVFIKIYFLFYLSTKNGIARSNPVDINLGINYKYSKNLFIFIKLNNLAHSKQTKFYNYNNYGYNGMLGAKVEF